MTKIRTKPNKKAQATSSLKVEKAVRDSYTVPSDEHKYLRHIQEECLKKATYVNKSEILRVGLMAIKDMPIKEFLKMWKSLPKLSPGRPTKTDK